MKHSERMAVEAMARRISDPSMVEEPAFLKGYEEGFNNAKQLVIEYCKQFRSQFSENIYKSVPKYGDGHATETQLRAHQVRFVLDDCIKTVSILGDVEPVNIGILRK